MIWNRNPIDTHIDFKTRKLTQEALNKMNITNTATINDNLLILTNKIDTIIEKLKDLNHDVIMLSETEREVINR